MWESSQNPMSSLDGILCSAFLLLFKERNPKGIYGNTSAFSMSQPGARPAVAFKLQAGRQLHPNPARP